MLKSNPQMTDPKIVLEAQKDNKKREALIEAQLEQIRKSASKTAGYWVDQHDDIYSEAMIAFNDAITAYDPEKGDPDNGVAPGTAWENVPEDWVCPVCGLGKDAFELE